MSFWLPSLRTNTGRILPALAILILGLFPVHALAQAGEDMLSQREVDSLRDAAFVPMERILVFEQILNDRQKRLENLQAKRRGHTDFAAEMHDVVEQFGAITDELNDNLDEYSRKHRDIRKALPKLIEATERWSTALRTPAEAEGYAVVRRIALDNVKDARELAQTLQTDLDTYFKAHPDAEQAEKKRNADPHAVHGEDAKPQ
ncbi:MAG: hypothetical protein ACRYFU_12315 [Janthinobacterium lividum]